MDSEYEPVCGSAIRRTCSWCHTLNRLYRGRANHCVCGHRADLPMSECDCPACNPGRHRDEVARADARDREAIIKLYLAVFKNQKAHKQRKFKG